MAKVGTVTINNARIIFRNFAGVEGKYNRAGDRNFAVLLEPELAAAMEADGWNVKYLNQREEDDFPQAYVQVSVAYKGRPPHIVMITSRNRTMVDEDLVEMLDTVDIKNVDLILNPYEYNVNGSAGIKAYLKTMFLTIEEDELQLRYAEDLEDLPTRSGRTYED